MATRYRFGDSNRPHFITFAVINWIDVFTREAYKQIFVDSPKYSMDHKSLSLHAWIIMPNHVHLIASVNKESIQLSDIMRDIKKYTSRMIVKAIEENQQESRKDWLLWMFRRAAAINSNNNQHQFWQQDNHPIELTTNQMIDQRLNYLHENPVTAGLVWKAEDYKYSSAIDYYCEQSGLLPVELLV